MTVPLPLLQIGSMHTSNPSDSRYALSRHQTSRLSNGTLQIELSGRIDASAAATLLPRLQLEIDRAKPRRIQIQLPQVSYFDDYGTALLGELRDQARRSKIEFNIDPASEPALETLQRLHFFDRDYCLPIRRKRQTPNWLVQLGDHTIQSLFSIKEMIAFLGAVFTALWRVLRHPGALRWRDTIAFMEKTGVNAVPIIALISFLLGSVMAFMSAMQLKQFGANIYVASLVALAMVSELGPIMTAVVVSGRSGSAYAAEIGTMIISEEVDALVAMGFDPALFLALPRILAALIVVPLLTIFSCIFAIAGGMTVGVFGLDLTVRTYISQTLEVLTLFEVMWGLMKSVIFALLVAMIGCLRGFQTSGGADAVGRAATSAVVTGIFFIILFDSAFAIIRSYI